MVLGVIMIMMKFECYHMIMELKPGFHIIVAIVAVAENVCDDPDDHMETSIFLAVTIVTIRIVAVVEIETSSISTIETIQ